MRKFGVVFILLVMSIFAVVANPDSKGGSVSSVNLTVDTYYQHQWRGFFSGNTPTIEPSVTFTTGNLSFGVWGASTFNNSYQEIDLYAIYSKKGFTIGVYNYFDPSGNFLDANYLELEKGKTEHLYSVDASYVLPVFVPLKFTLSTLAFGSDVHATTNEYAFSTYFETSYVHSFGKFSVKGAVGAALNESIYNGYSENFSLVNTLAQVKYNVVVKEKYNFPLHVMAVYNPYADKFQITGGISFSTDFKL